MTEEERTRTIAALEEELRGYKLRGLSDRAAQVLEQLRALGAAPKRTARPRSDRLRGKAAEKR